MTLIVANMAVNMPEQQSIGIYGKIPAHGDFLNQNLPRDFLDVWDHWLQQSILASQEVLGEEWLNYFLISPVWRFVLPAGTINEQAWAGIMLPSVDKVGRYYPLTLASPVPDSVGVCEYMVEARSWFMALENIAIMTLENGLDMEALLLSLNQNCRALDFREESLGKLASQHQLQHVIPLTSFQIDNAENPINPMMAPLCDALLQSHHHHLSAWWTEGSEHVNSACLLADKLPRPTSYTAMLNGQWHNWHWPNLLQSRSV